ncbi:hypothetical protein J5N97_012467 [Dioscorea zingiberensis]|uniref:Uncharacterized protein n=1 Tax=Dioscorea zingiberensis TaxID=325984 RepID=A0A9D5CNY0_9LILI|nr:hypothetical protein J5N97_012467 [Dioscorea zingiberensis]
MGKGLASASRGGGEEEAVGVEVMSTQGTDGMGLRLLTVQGPEGQVPRERSRDGLDMTARDLSHHKDLSRRTRAKYSDRDRSKPRIDGDKYTEATQSQPAMMEMMTSLHEGTLEENDRLNLIDQVNARGHAIDDGTELMESTVVNREERYLSPSATT